MQRKGTFTPASRHAQNWDKRGERRPQNKESKMTTTVRRATDADMAQVMEWLRAEWEANGRKEGAYCNRDLIAEAHAARRSWVVAQGDDVLAFQTDERSAPSIFVVRPEVRGWGYGELLTKHMLRRWRRRTDTLDIQAIPSSRSYWRRFGFRQVNDFTMRLKFKSRAKRVASGGNSA
jgi:GNAT superfamily N-acetyltransferase